MSEHNLEVAAVSGVTDKMPSIECFANQHPGKVYVHEIEVAEYSSRCPATGMPDFGTVLIRYIPCNLIMELKSLKLYFHAYRDKGIFYENLVNKVTEDIAETCFPLALEVECIMTPRGGISSRLYRSYGKDSRMLLELQRTPRRHTRL